MQRIRMLDDAYRYGYVSEGVRGVFGLDADWLMAQEAVDHAWIHDEDRARFLAAPASSPRPLLAALEASARDLAPLDEEVRVIRPDGVRKWVRSIGRPRRQADGTTIWDGVALDVTERREALDAMQRTLEAARKVEVSEARLAFIAAEGMAQPLMDLRLAVGRLGVRRGGAFEVEDVMRSFGAFDRAMGASRKLLVARSPGDGGAARLTRRQIEVARLLRDGASNADIAGALGVTDGTAKPHVSAILRRVGARNRTEAVAIIFGG